MSFTVHINRCGTSGICIGAPQILPAATEDDAISLALLELRRAPKASHPLMFRIYEAATHRLVLSFSPGSKPGLA